MQVVLPGPVGALEGVLEVPDDEVRAAAVVCHPHPLHGGTLQNTVVFRTARALRSAGVATLRFNFRGVGASEGAHDGGPGEVQDLNAALDFLAERYPGLPLWAGGFSFGARTVCARGGGSPDAQANAARVERVVLVALPSKAYDCGCAAQLETPGLAVFGSRDEFGNLGDFRARVQVPPELELVEIEGADHFFRGRTPVLERAIETHAREALSP